MSWGEVELEQEVRDWFLSLDEADEARVAYRVDRLADLGPIILLTVFAKTQRRERHEIRRAREAMERCMTERHTATEEEDS